MKLCRCPFPPSSGFPFLVLSFIDDPCMNQLSGCLSNGPFLIPRFFPHPSALFSQEEVFLLQSVCIHTVSRLWIVCYLIIRSDVHIVLDLASKSTFKVAHVSFYFVPIIWASSGKQDVPGLSYNFFSPTLESYIFFKEHSALFIYLLVLGYHCHMCTDRNLHTHTPVDVLFLSLHLLKNTSSGIFHTTGFVLISLPYL